MIRGLTGVMFERKSDGAWTNPYVTDGLVSMFDGEWNNGGGVHSDTELSDIVSGYAMTKPAQWGIAAKHLAVTSTAPMTVNQYRGGAAITVEIVTAFTDNNLTRECVFEDSNANTSFRIKRQSNGLFCSFVGSGVVIPIQSGVATYTVTQSDTPSNPNHVTEGFINGVYQSYAYFGHKMLGRYGGSFRIGRNVYTAYQNINSIRIYDRVLTNAEIAANAAVDASRFNIA